MFHAAVGVSVCPELDVDSLLAGIPADDKEKRQSALADAAWKGVFDEYQSLVDAIDGGADKCGEGYSQPWKKYPQPALDQWL